MKRILALVICLIGLSGYAQKDQKVVLKNGSELKGSIVEQDNDKIHLKMKDGSVFVYQRTEIESIEKYIPVVESKGYFFRPSMGVAGGEQFSLSLHLLNGYRFNKFFEVGLGFGIENLWSGYVPVFGEGRFYIPKTNGKLFVYGMAGYEMPINGWDWDKGGFTTGGGAGMQHTITEHFSFYTQVGYRYAHLKQRNWWGDDSFIINNVNRIELRIGFNIK